MILILSTQFDGPVLVEMRYIYRFFTHYYDSLTNNVWYFRLRNIILI